MFLLAKTISKHSKPAADWLLQLFNTYNTTKLNDLKIKQIKQVCNCLIYNLTKPILLGCRELPIILDKTRFSERFVINGQKSKSTPIDYQSFKLFLKVLEECGCVVDVGGFCGYNDYGETKFKQSVLVLSDYIYENLFTLLQDVEIPTIENVLILRDENKKPKTFTSNATTQQMLKGLRMYNKTLADFDIRNEKGEKLFVNARRIFNDSFDKGGRFYNDQAVVQSLSSEERSKLTINGSKVTELDFVALHPTILATEAGYIFPEGFDPYDIEMKGYETKTLRKLAKMAMLIRLNCNSDSSYKLAMNHWIGNNLDIKQLYQENKIPKIYIEVDELLYAIIDKNPYLYETFISEAIVGLRLQGVDSAIADSVLNYFTQRSVACISIHDSFIVPVDYQEELKQTMHFAFKERLGTDVNCKVDIKY